MGYDIELINKNNEVVKTEYFSYNWNMYKHCAAYFNAKRLYGHSGEKGVIDHLESVLNDLDQKSEATKVDGWGDPLKDIILSEEELKSEQLSMFATHIQRFLETAKKFPDARWYIDDYEISEKLNGHCGVERKDLPGYCSDDSDDDSNDDDQPIAYYQHPIKGTIRVDSYEKAMEIHLLQLKEKDVRASGWYNLALQMPDCPEYI